MGKNVVIRDSNRVPVGLAPCGIETVEANAPIPWNAISCQSDIIIYFEGNSSKTWPISAGKLLGITSATRLTFDAECLVF